MAQSYTVCRLEAEERAMATRFQTHTAALFALTLLGACSHKFSVSLNEQMLYDPRPGNTTIRVADPGLQSCINVLMREREITDFTTIEVLACPGLEIASLAGIGQLTNLRFIDLAGNELVNLDGLQYLQRLSSVNAPNNKVQDIAALLRNNTLTSAVLTGNDLIPCVQLDELAQRLGNSLLRPEQCMP